MSDCPQVRPFPLFRPWCWVFDHIWFPCSAHDERQIECLRCGHIVPIICYTEWG